jgi:hypothetical protein
MLLHSLTRDHTSQPVVFGHLPARSRLNAESSLESMVKEDQLAQLPTLEIDVQVGLLSLSWLDITCASRLFIISAISSREIGTDNEPWPGSSDENCHQ